MSRDALRKDSGPIAGRDSGALSVLPVHLTRDLAAKSDGTGLS